MAVKLRQLAVTPGIWVGSLPIGPLPAKKGNDRGSQAGERAVGAVGAKGDSGAVFSIVQSGL